MLSRREEVDDDVLEYIEASLRAHQQKEEKDRHAELALIEAAEEAKRERLERGAERRNLAAAAANRLARRTRYAAIVATVLALMAGAGALVAFRAQQEAKVEQRGNATRRCATSLFRSRFFRSSPRRQATPRLQSSWRSKHCPRKTRPSGHISLKRRQRSTRLCWRTTKQIFRHGAGVADARVQSRAAITSSPHPTIKLQASGTSPAVPKLQF